MERMPEPRSDIETWSIEVDNLIMDVEEELGAAKECLEEVEQQPGDPTVWARLYEALQSVRDVAQELATVAPPPGYGGEG